MPNLARRGASHHRRRMPVANGETITLRRGDKTITVEAAMQSPNSVSILNAEGLQVQVAMTDWWLPADQMLLDEAEAANNEPRMGDVITSEDGLVFEPMRPDAGTPAVGSVCMGKFWIVHTKQTGP